MRALLPLLAACSFSVRTVPHDYQARRGGPPPPCEGDFAGRALADLGGAAAFAYVAYFAYGFSSSRCAPDGECDREVSAAVPFLIPAALYLTAIVIGERAASNCTRVRAEHARLQR